MIRIIVRTTDGSLAGNLGGPGTPIDVNYKTFDIDAPALEAFLRAPEKWGTNHCTDRSVIGAEVLKCDVDTKQE